jgi:O-6-methylguanine DNA methyltransferase
MSQIWIFKQDQHLIGYVLRENTVMAATIPREEMKEVQNSLKQVGFQVPTAAGKLPIIHENESSEAEKTDPETAYAAHVGRSLMQTFFGDEWNPEIPFAYPPHLPEFTRRVLEETRKIPKGKVATYGEIADRIGSPGGSRAVGNALGRNPLPLIIPCHRVVKADGRVGGFMQTADGSVRSTLKREMLEREGVKFRKGKVIRAADLAIHKQFT